MVMQSPTRLCSEASGYSGTKRRNKDRSGAEEDGEDAEAVLCHQVRVAQQSLLFDVPNCQMVPASLQVLGHLVMLRNNVGCMTGCTRLAEGKT
jgi:hypothetical protein